MPPFHGPLCLRPSFCAKCKYGGRPILGGCGGAQPPSVNGWGGAGAPPQNIINANLLPPDSLIYCTNPSCQGRVSECLKAPGERITSSRAEIRIWIAIRNIKCSSHQHKQLQCLHPILDNKSCFHGPISISFLTLKPIIISYLGTDLF